MTDIHLLTLLLLESGLPIDEVLRIVETAPLRYKRYSIPKRGGGFRQIAQPARELKILQYVLLENVLSLFPVHRAATAYEAGRSIRANAANHLGAHVLLKLDFREFFPSLKPRDWEVFVRKSEHINTSEQDLKVASRLLFWGDGSRNPVRLSVGAPTSPKLSNILLYDIDCLFHSIAAAHSVSYTRYADDITVSGMGLDKVLSFEREIRKAIKNCRSPKLTFNEEKRGLFYKGQKQMVTGLILTPDRQVSIGRERKRLVNVLLHRIKQGVASPQQIGTAKGYLAFSISAEPDFVGRMRSKYGDEVVDFALTFFIPSRDPA